MNATRPGQRKRCTMNTVIKHKSPLRKFDPTAPWLRRANREGVVKQIIRRAVKNIAVKNLGGFHQVQRAVIPSCKETLESPLRHRYERRTGLGFQTEPSFIPRGNALFHHLTVSANASHFSLFPKRTRLFPI